MDAPKIGTAILALTRDGEGAPCLFVTSEQNPPSARADGSHQLRVVAGNGEKVLGSSDGLTDLDNFATVSIGIAKQLFQLDDEQETQLL